MSQFHRRVALEAVCFGPAPHSVSFRDCCPQDAGFVGERSPSLSYILAPPTGLQSEPLTFVQGSRHFRLSLILIEKSVFKLVAMLE